jgi:hypothetical protein
MARTNYQLCGTHLSEMPDFSAFRKGDIITIVDENACSTCQEEFEGLGDAAVEGMGWALRDGEERGVEKMESFVVLLSSEEYGEETFKYLSLQEAKEGFKRLQGTCSAEYEKDGINRTLRLVTIHDEWDA